MTNLDVFLLLSGSFFLGLAMGLQIAAHDMHRLRNLIEDLLDAQERLRKAYMQERARDHNTSPTKEAHKKAARSYLDKKDKPLD